MKKSPLVSIIIPLYFIIDRFFNDFKRYEKLDYDNFEILVVCDKKVEIPKLKNTPIKLLLTKRKNTGPAEKRDLAIKYASGSICAFVDDDAYPDRDWLKNAVPNFEDKSIAAVGGPGLTPPEDNYWEQITGLVYSSFFCSGFAQYRFVKGKRKFIEDYPAYNLLVRKDVLKKIGGYGSYFYGGEDTFLCLKIIREGYKILYDPRIVVHHHRRPLFFGYLKQIANVGKHRGYFAKKFPETSLKLLYFIPSVLAIGFFILLVGSLVNYQILLVYLSLLSLFMLISYLSIIRKTNTIKGLLAAGGIILTHLTYGISFIRGLLLANLKR